PTVPPVPPHDALPISILRTASGSVRTCRSFTYLAMTRGKFPKLRGCGSPVSSGTPICITAPASLPMLVHGKVSDAGAVMQIGVRSEEHTSELQSLTDL